MARINNNKIAVGGHLEQLEVLGVGLKGEMSYSLPLSIEDLISWPKRVIAFLNNKKIVGWSPP